MPADPTPAPEWAVKDAKRFAEGAWYDALDIHRLAHLLAGVRDAALREAAGECMAITGRMQTIKRSDPSPSDAHGRGCYIEGVKDSRTAILALVGTAPRPTQSDTATEGSEAPRG